MNRQTVNVILAIYLIVVWGAVIFRVDRFPITWVPMYSVYKVKDTISSKVWDKKRYKKGLRVTHRDGSVSYVSYKDLNIPKPNFRRLYYSRVFGSGPPKHNQGNTSLEPYNRWIRGLGPDEKNFSVDWQWRMFWTLNKTLGHEPADPKFITRIEASHTKRYYRKADLLRGDPSNVTIKNRVALNEWQDTYLTRWKHGSL